MGDDGRVREGMKGGKNGKRKEEGGRDRVSRRGRMGKGGGRREHERLREREWWEGRTEELVDGKGRKKQK